MDILSFSQETSKFDIRQISAEYNPPLTGAAKWLFKTNK